MTNSHHNPHTQPWMQRESEEVFGFLRGERKGVTKIRGQNICTCYIVNIFLDVTVACCKNLNNDEELDVGVILCI